ncbi:hypothetical protein C8J57DRAFT_1440748 [Mycena rebaudengoi]|nr:hypothetical protein C8J57DRAFT_1440748 [Mycena rebaudengoi]
MDICKSCRTILGRKKQPVNTIANFQYYGRDELPSDAKAAFKNASLFDLMMMSRSHATWITHLFSCKKGTPLYGSNDLFSQRYSQDNVAIFAQDVPTGSTVLPPNIPEMQEAMWALFIGEVSVPTMDDIKNLSPDLVSENRMATLIDFLVNENDIMCLDNMESLFSSVDAHLDSAVLRGVELACLADSSAAATSSYTDCADRPMSDTASSDIQTPMVMEAVGYIAGETGSINYEKMKATALTCSKFISDWDPGLLTFDFPQLDPWGVGGVFNPCHLHLLADNLY